VLFPVKSGDTFGMALLLTVIAVIAGTGFALYCMVCERIEANRRRRATLRTARPDTSTFPEPALGAVAGQPAPALAGTPWQGDAPTPR
jgi:hypothetical protein